MNLFTLEIFMTEEDAKKIIEILKKYTKNNCLDSFKEAQFRSYIRFQIRV